MIFRNVYLELWLVVLAWLGVLVWLVVLIWLVVMGWKVPALGIMYDQNLVVVRVIDEGVRVRVVLRWQWKRLHLSCLRIDDIYGLRLSSRCSCLLLEDQVVIGSVRNQVPSGVPGPRWGTDN